MNQGDDYTRRGHNDGSLEGEAQNSANTASMPAGNDQYGDGMMQGVATEEQDDGVERRRWLAKGSPRSRGQTTGVDQDGRASAISPEMASSFVPRAAQGMMQANEGSRTARDHQVGVAQPRPPSESQTPLPSSAPTRPGS